MRRNVEVLHNNVGEEGLLESSSINKKQLLLGCLFLLAGTLEYLVSRPMGSTYFLAEFDAIQSFRKCHKDVSKGDTL
jgi:hypothetical protein